MATILRQMSGMPVALNAVRVVRKAWSLLPANAERFLLIRRAGGFIHRAVLTNGHRWPNHGTYMLRNRPELDWIRQHLANQNGRSKFSAAVLGCSVGMELYSIRWRLRELMQSMDIQLIGMDIDRSSIDQAISGEYPLSIYDWTFSRMSESERQEIFETHGEALKIRPQFRTGIRWLVGDADDDRLTEQIGSQDLVVANRFLCHMQPNQASACLQNIAKLVAPGGYLLVSGVDLSVRQSVMSRLNFTAVTDGLAEIHEGDPSLRAGWPWNSWGLEPLDRKRADWIQRYAMIWRKPEASTLHI
jgi:chemotaxis methyl-accepting protein methylase